MPVFIRILVALLAIAAPACTSDPARDPDAQQLARINKELAILNAQVEALSQRLDRLELARKQPESHGQPATATPPGEHAAPASDQAEQASDQAEQAAPPRDQADQAAPAR